MRPGPGLVVMALAFISGARRGSTSTSTSSKISATSYSTSSTATIATPIRTQSTLVAIVTPPTTTTTTTTTTTSSSRTRNNLYNFQVPQFVPTYPDPNLSKTDKRKDSGNSEDSGGGGGSGGVLSTIRNLRKRKKKKTDDFQQQQQSDTFRLPLYELPTHFKHFYDQTQTSRNRRSISASKAASTTDNIVVVERTRRGIYASSSLLSSSASSSLSSLPSSSTEELETNNNFEEGLTVQYSQPSDPSNSFDEDDILGLVEEEHSLISEESFDQLQKLTQNQINNVNEEDYSEGVGSYSSRTHTQTGTGTVGSGSDSQSYSETAEEKEVGSKSTSVGSFAIISDSQLLDEQKGKLKKESEQLPLDQSEQPEQLELKNYYAAANLVSDKPNHISSNRIATLSWSLVEENNVKKNTVNISDKRNLELPKKSIIESASPLTRLNPWISACDLAQPGTAPDLQGQCSASALPVAWVDEGPGPPICPESCALRKRRKTKRSVNVINLNINKNYDNKFNENQLPYIKSNNYYNDNDHVDHKNNNYYNNNNNNNNNKKSLSYNNNNYDKIINNNKENRQKQQQITKHMSNKVRRNAAVKTEVSSSNIAQIQRTTTTTTTTTMTRTKTMSTTTEDYTGTTRTMAMTSTMKTPLSTTTMTSITPTETELKTETGTAIYETETAPETSTQETKNAKYSTEPTKSITNRLMANLKNNNINKWNNEEDSPQLVEHKNNATTILNNNINNNNNDNDTNSNSNRNSNEQQQYSNLYDGELKYSYLLQPDEHNLDEYDSNKKLNENDKFKLLHDEQVERRKQQYQQEAAVAENDEQEQEEEEEEEELMLEEDVEVIEMEKTQCLDYLGDSLETSPLHLCSLKSPGQLVSRLRTLRLRHCCERNVFSALHTIALNATLSGGVECVRILMDIIDLDALATRITCEYAEILFRFDCRQVYSLIHQCHDCKEAYRRWVCSTLVPYFAEPSDVITPIFNTTATTSNNNNNNNNNNNKLQSNIIHDHKGNMNMTSKKSRRNVLIGNTNSCLHQLRKTVFENVLDYYTHNKSTSIVKLMNHNSTQKSISTADNDPCSQTDSVISKVNRRTKRRIEFRRRKRIRPCLSVCQTVEQLCPYLLPADRAPAMPTQYAGEPTFLCLDLNIPEVTEQKESSINGRSDCCYTYCGNMPSGICVQCDAFAWSVLNSYDALAGPNITKHVHNITLTPNAENALSARISIALRNDSDSDRAISQRAMESLSYYAYYDGIYYYDDELQDMPYQAISGNCETVPSVTGRCTVPYYATGAGSNHPRSSLLWASLLACCLYNVYLATCQPCQKYPHRKLSNNNTELNSKSCQNWEIRRAESKVSGCRRMTTLHRFQKITTTPQNSRKLYRYSKAHIKNYYCRAYILSLFRKSDIQSQITIKSFIQNNTLTYKSCKKINNKLHISGRSKNNNNNSKRNKYYFYKFQLFHYINFNINDWWRRWCEFTSTIVAL